MCTQLKALQPVRHLCVRITGRVQSVGFRPFVRILARSLGLVGWVRNTSEAVIIEAEGEAEILKMFLERLETEQPPNAKGDIVESVYSDELIGYGDFAILKSDDAGSKTVVVMPDLATCAQCVKELFDPADRRYLYPFGSCTNCGPRYTIVRTLPYDRPNTTLDGFPLCADCAREYGDPNDRRYHAQPIACPVCGPQLALWDPDGKELAWTHDALLQAAVALRCGRIVAVKGIGGFHLMVDARNEGAVRMLRTRKHRDEKPLALMYPNIELVRRHCFVSELEEQLLLSVESPIVLLRARDGAFTGEHGISSSVAPGNPYLGVMLPYSPLHHILMAELSFPVVATSGNRSDEPIVTDEHKALSRLAGIADLFLVHNRPIVAHVDDSIVRVVAGEPIMYRRSRGYAPLPLIAEGTHSVLAVGPRQKSTIAVSQNENVFVYPHLGDHGTVAAHNAFEKAMDDALRMRDLQLDTIACDLHPDYEPTVWARSYAARMGIPLIPVQHHVAHGLSCMIENGITGRALCFAFDGTGFGLDGTIWGGEALLIGHSGVERVGHMRTFPLPGGDLAAREPRRALLGLMWALDRATPGVFVDRALTLFTETEWALVQHALKRSLNTPHTSSVGRLFDAVSALLVLPHAQKQGYEGQAAMELEWAADNAKSWCAYPFMVRDVAPYVIDWEPMVRAMVEAIDQHVDQAVIAARFHSTLVAMVVHVAELVGERTVCLTGGCFQNKRLLEGAIVALRKAGFLPRWHHEVPTNDGGISLGQVAFALRCLATTNKEEEDVLCNVP